jgi:lysophospholipase L1-like esterase
VPFQFRRIFRIAPAMRSRLACLLVLLPLIAARAADERIDSYQYDLKDGNLASLGDAWTVAGDSIVSPDKGLQFTYPNEYSALKNFTVEATLAKLAGGPGAAAGIHVGVHVGIPLNGWNFLYTPASGEFRYEFRTPQETKLLGQKVQKMDLPIRFKFETDTNARWWKLYANDQLIFNLPTGSLPVLWETGVSSLDGAAEFSRLHITGGDIWKPVIAAGDSITHHCGWVQLASAESGVPIGNAGMASDTTSGVVKRLDTDVIRLHPKCAILFIGTNDPTADTVYANYPIMLDRLKEAGIQPILCTALPRQGWDKIDKINAFLKQLAQDRQLPLVDWHDALQGTPGNLAPKYSMNGPVHPNPEGVKIMVSLFLANEQVAKIFQQLKGSASPAAAP